MYKHIHTHIRTYVYTDMPLPFTKKEQYIPKYFQFKKQLV